MLKKEKQEEHLTQKKETSKYLENSNHTALENHQIFTTQLVVTLFLRSLHFLRLFLSYFAI